MKKPSSKPSGSNENHYAVFQTGLIHILKTKFSKISTSEIVVNLKEKHPMLSINKFFAKIESHFQEIIKQTNSNNIEEMANNMFQVIDQLNESLLNLKPTTKGINYFNILLNKDIGRLSDLLMANSERGKHLGAHNFPDIFIENLLPINNNSEINSYLLKINAREEIILRCIPKVVNRIKYKQNLQKYIADIIYTEPLKKVHLGFLSKFLNKTYSTFRSPKDDITPDMAKQINKDLLKGPMSIPTITFNLISGGYLKDTKVASKKESFDHYNDNENIIKIRGENDIESA